MYCPKGSHDGPLTSENKPGAAGWGSGDRIILLNLEHGKSKEDDPIVWETWRCEICSKEWKQHLSYYVLITKFEWCQEYYKKLIKKWDLKGIR